MSFQIRRFFRSGSAGTPAVAAPRTLCRRPVLAGAAAVVATTSLLASPAEAHDRCDSLANAATAAGVFYPPAAGFQVGYYLAKFVDELGEEESVDPDVFDCNGAVSLSPDDYARITGNTDPTGAFYPYWKETGAFIQASYDFNFAKARWQQLREAVLDAKLAGDADLAEALQAETDAAYGMVTTRLGSYKDAHDTYATTIAEAARIYREREFSFVPPLGVDTVVKVMQASLDGQVPEFEIRFWVDIACTPPGYIDAEGLLAPADRFVNDEVPPGTYLDAEMLESPATIFDNIAATLATDVKAAVDRLLPDNDALAAPCAGDLNGDGIINVGDLGIILGMWGNACP